MQVPELWRDIQSVKLEKMTKKFYHTRPFFGYLCDQYYWLNSIPNEYSKEEIFLQNYVLTELVSNWFFYWKYEHGSIGVGDPRIEKYHLLTLVTPAKIALLRQGCTEYTFRVPTENGEEETIIEIITFKNDQNQSWNSLEIVTGGPFRRLRNDIAHGIGTVSDEMHTQLSAAVRDVIVDAARLNPTDEELDEDLRLKSTKPKSKEWFRTVEKWLNAPDPLLFSIPELS